MIINTHKIFNATVARQTTDVVQSTVYRVSVAVQDELTNIQAAASAGKGWVRLLCMNQPDIANLVADVLYKEYGFAVEKRSHDLWIVNW